MANDTSPDGKIYLFESKRLGFRNWSENDIEPMSALNSDPLVMEFFPGVLGREETTAFVERMQRQFAEKGFCYFAVDMLENQEFIGFIGMSEKTFEASFTPCTDMGWRLKRAAWNKGLATEGAKSCLEYAFNHLDLERVCAITPAVNLRSEHIMKKIGMKKVLTFLHPELDGRLKRCVLYEIARLSH